MAIRAISCRHQELQEQRALADFGPDPGIQHYIEKIVDEQRAIRQRIDLVGHWTKDTNTAAGVRAPELIKISIADWPKVDFVIQLRELAEKAGVTALPLAPGWLSMLCLVATGTSGCRSRPECV